MADIVVDARMIRSSGIGALIANVLPILAAQREAWHFRVLGDVEELRQFTWSRAPNVELERFVAPIHSISEQLAWRSIRASVADVLWAPNYNIPLRWPGRLLVTIHDVAHLALQDIFGSIPKRLYARAMFARVRQRADALLCNSAFTAAEFRRLVGAPRRTEAHVVHHGVDPGWFEIPPGARPYPKPYILFVGNVKPHKNLARLIDAFGLVREKIPHDLLIVGQKEGFVTGDTSIGDRLETFAGRVALTGFVSDDQLRQLFAHAQGLVLPSLYEGFGLPPLEAMAAGTPTLVAKAGSLPEICADASLYCDPLDVGSIADGLTRLVTDENLRRALRQKGTSRAAALTWEACARGYAGAIEDLIAMSRSKA